MNPENLGFDAVPTSLEDRVRVPAGYRAEVLFAKGDPIEAGVSEFLNDGTDVDPIESGILLMPVTFTPASPTGTLQTAPGSGGN